jgi:hypothetical protein
MSLFISFLIKDEFNFQLGMAVGHIYYFLEDVFPNQPGGMKLLRTPRILRIICDGETDDDRAYQPLPEGDRPGGYAWGQQGQDQAGDEQHNDNNNDDRR